MSMISRQSSRRTMLKLGAALGVAAAALPGFGGWRGFPALAQDDAAWEAEPDAGAGGRAGAGDHHLRHARRLGQLRRGLLGASRRRSASTDGMHTDTDMSSLEEITKFDAEKANPIAMFADIGMLWGRWRPTAAWCPPTCRRPPRRCPRATRAATGGWVASFAGVPAFVVNVDALGGADIPMTWDDLLREDLQGQGWLLGRSPLLRHLADHLPRLGLRPRRRRHQPRPRHRVLQADHPAVQRGRGNHRPAREGRDRALDAQRLQLRSGGRPAHGEGDQRPDRDSRVSRFTRPRR